MPQAPWEKYGQTEQGPWTKYSSAPSETSDTAGDVTGGESTASQYAGRALKYLGTEAVPELLSGIGGGMGKTVAGTADLLRHVPGLKSVIPEQGVQALRSASEARTPWEQLGEFGEQAGEFAIPGLAEEKTGLVAAKVAPKVAEYAPRLAKYLPGAARVAKGAATAGVQTAMQTGKPEQFETGAALGAGAGLLGEAAQAAAPALAESALGIRSAQKLHGKTPGPAALEELTGIRPGTLERQAGEKMTELNAQKDALIRQADDRLIRGGLQARQRLALPPATQDIPLHEAKMPEMPGGLYPAETRLSASEAGATDFPTRVTEADLHDPAYLTSFKGPGPEPVGPYEPGVLRRPTPPGGMFPQQTRMALPPDAPNLKPVVDRIRAEVANPETNFETKRALVNMYRREIEPFMTADGKVLPSELDHLKVRLGKTISSWDRMKIKPSEGFEQSVYGNLDSELDRVVGPQHADLNQRISSLIPVAQRSKLLELQPGVGGRALQRVAAHTGALTGSALGIHEGYKRGGVPGATVGGLAGLIFPEMVGSPTGKMATARIMKSPGLATRGLTGIAAQAFKPGQ